jgi:hypothetical protein
VPIYGVLRLFWLVCLIRYIPPAATPPEIEATRWAKQHWHESIGWTPQIAAIRTRLSSDAKVKAMDRKEGKTILGWYTYDTGEITYVRDRLKSEHMWHAVALHEVGHAIGLKHVDGYGVMNEAPLDPCISPLDAAEFERVRGTVADPSCP